MGTLFVLLACLLACWLDWLDRLAPWDLGCRLSRVGLSLLGRIPWLEGVASSGPSTKQERRS